VIEALDVSSIYLIPEALHKQSVDSLVIKKLNLKSKKKFDRTWFSKIDSKSNIDKKIKIAVVGKYVNLKDAYKSIEESLNIAAAHLNSEVKIHYINSEDKSLVQKIKDCDAVLVPGGFGNRGVEGKIRAITYARENKIPFLGICLGMQCSIIEAARNLVNLKNANSTEFDANTKFPVIKILAEQENIKYRGGTMRLGNYSAEIKKDSLAYSLYKTDKIEERHRHRYEMNPEFIKKLEKAGLIVSAYHKRILPEIVELKNHPFFIGVQFHPEFGSRLMKPHPLFMGFLKAAMNNGRSI
jgi:CTP synthase